VKTENRVPLLEQITEEANTLYPLTSASLDSLSGTAKEEAKDAQEQNNWVQQLRKHAYIKGALVYSKGNEISATNETLIPYSKAEQDFQLIQMKALGISDQQSFEQMVNTAISMALESKKAKPNK
jgi:hypothetical protein